MFGEYVRHGWSICSITPGQKGPLYAGWNEPKNAIVDPEVADILDGAGLLHVPSKTCAIDIDHVAAARDWLADQLIDLDALLNAPDAVRISSGKAGHAKLLYRLDTPMMSAKIIQEIDGKKTNIIDLRCAVRGGKSCQDVLPGTPYPGTDRRYEWDYADPICGDWRCLPVLPPELMAAWGTLLAPETPSVPDGSHAAPLGLEPLQALLAGQDPDMARDDWVNVLSAIHWETQGSDAGLQLAIAWSAKGKKFTDPTGGVADVEARWRSFSLDHPNPRTAASLRDDAPASVDEFPDVPPAQIAAEAAVATPNAKNRRKDLIKRLVYVRSADRYYDIEIRDLLLGDHALNHSFSSWFSKKIKPTDLMMRAPDKKTVAGMRFHPGAGSVFTDDGEEFANAFRPLGVEPRPPTQHEKDMIEWLFNRIDDVTFREWLKQFLAHAVQRPGVKIRSCPLIWSEETGNGKSTLMKTIPALLFGAQYSCDVNVDAVEEKFNGFLPTAWHVYLDEFRAGTRTDRMAVAAKLKPWITNNTVTVREMRRDTYTMPNRFVMTATSNEPDSAPIDKNDRRWAVHEMKAPRMTPEERQQYITEFLDKPARAAPPLLHYFLNHSIVGFDPNAEAIHTTSREEMIEASKTSDIEAIDLAWEEHSGPFTRDVCTAQEVQDLCRSGGFRPSLHYIGRTLAKLGGVQRRINLGAGKQRLWIMRNHRQWATCSEIYLAQYINGEIIVDELAT